MKLAGTMFVVFLVAATIGQGVAAAQEDRPALRLASGAGYLTRDQMPDSAALLPPPPEAGSRAQRRDDRRARAAVAIQGTPRWRLAAVDADLFSPDSTGVFSCAAGFRIGEQATPAINRLLRRAMIDFAGATFAAKRKYTRARPFMVNGRPTCTPADEALLRRDGSYPSGHSAIGFGTGLILAEIVPAQSSALIARGKAFGDSRRVCNAHWLSDVEAGRTIAVAVVERLGVVPAFQADLAAAKAEAVAARGASQPDCAEERAALRR
ncbi:MAG TPA: phosphatase PAP2 family protein [Sphingobium sp.]|nr:phosphatase PAP2 family protein [Sphingobium sp.]